MKIAIATVFLPRENVYWLEEWIRYHLFHIGIDAIYLYDNTGSQRRDHVPVEKGGGVFATGKNRKGVDVLDMTSHLSDRDIENILNKIILKYIGRVVVVPWKPTDENGIPCYGQKQSYQHFLKNYGNLFDWACLTDIDEFIVNSDLKEKVLSFEKRGYNDIIIHPKLFMQRVGMNGPIIPTLSITDYVENVTDRYWKQIIKCSDALRPQVHQGGAWKKEWKPLFNTGLIFHHYKIGPWCYQRMRNEIAFCPKTLKIGTDETLKKIIPSLLLDENINISSPKNTMLFESGPRSIDLPPSLFLQKLITVKEYIIVYAILKYRLLRTAWMFLKPDKPSKVQVKM